MFFKRTPKPEDPQINPSWVPPTDFVFQYLLQEALYGVMPVYFAAVSLPRLRRFAPEFRPERTTGGAAVVRSIQDRWRKGNFQAMWVYPKGDLFIVADDYFTLAAAESGKPDFCPCWILGPVGEHGVKDVQGPVEPTSLRKLLGLT